MKILKVKMSSKTTRHFYENHLLFLTISLPHRPPLLTPSADNLLFNYMFLNNRFILLFLDFQFLKIFSVDFTGLLHGKLHSILPIPPSPKRVT